MYRNLFILLLIILTVFSCKKETHQIKWKMPDSDVLIYKIQMETIDSLSSVTEDNMGVLVDMVAKMYGDTVEVPVNSNDLYYGLVKQLNMLSYFSILRKGSENEIKIDFITKQVKEYEQIKYLEIFNKFIRKAFFKGTMEPDGKLLSENGGLVFDPKINILFELPGKPVSIGETWALHIRPPDHAINKSQLDSIHNKVTFKDLLIDDNDSIAILEYRLQSPDKAGNAIQFTGIGKFSLVQGKWIEYAGVLSQKTSGLLPMNHVQTIKLSEISIETYKSLIKQAQKDDIFGYKTTSDENHSTDPLEKRTDNSPDCPEVFRVQLLATQHPINNVKAEFKNISMPIDEIIVNPSEKFKYKYTVGMECSKAKADELLKQIKSMGYPKAYIIKTSGN